MQLHKICVSVYHSKTSNELLLLHVPGIGSRNPCEMSADTSLQAMIHCMGCKQGSVYSVWPSVCLTTPHELWCHLEAVSAWQVVSWARTHWKTQTRIATLVPSFLYRNFHGQSIIWMTFLIGDCSNWWENWEGFGQRQFLWASGVDMGSSFPTIDRTVQEMVHGLKIMSWSYFDSGFSEFFQTDFFSDNESLTTLLKWNSSIGNEFETPPEGNTRVKKSPFSSWLLLEQERWGWWQPSAREHLFSHTWFSALSSSRVKCVFGVLGVEEGCPLTKVRLGLTKWRKNPI